MATAFQTNQRFDILIAGGGPAGSLAALLLQRQGLRVGLVDTPLDVQRIEGLAPRTLQVLQAQGLVEAAAMASPPLRRQARWGSLSGAPNQEHFIERRGLDACLRRAAESGGVTLLTDRVRQILPGEGLVGEQTGLLSAGLVIEARGRRATAAPGRRLGPASVAIAGFCLGDEGPGVSIIATPLGWVWRAAAPGFGRWVQLVRDAESLGPGQAGLAEAWQGFFEQPEAGKPERLAQPPSVRSAELRLVAPELDPLCPRLGDAAIAMDPLSGHGLFWALSSALSCQPLVQALLQGEEDLARRFYRERLAETFWRQARIGRDFHLLVEDWPEAAYWSKRQRWPDALPAMEGVVRPEIRKRVVVSEGRLLEAETLVTPADPGGVAFVCGHAIAPILRRLNGSPPPDLESFHSRILPEASPGEAAQILGWLKSRALLPRTTKKRDATTRIRTMEARL